jgi:hypothetical protein
VNRALTFEEYDAWLGFEFQSTSAVNARVRNNALMHITSSHHYQKYFDTRTGLMARWGRVESADPWYAPAPEILDLEISTNGCPNKCPWCYKGNTDAPAENMSLETFQRILGKMSTNLDSIAFGITGVKTNPDLKAMLRATRAAGVIPNLTMSGKDLEWSPADLELMSELTANVGAIAVSVYPGELDPTEMLLRWLCTERAMPGRTLAQVNIHLMLSEETYEHCHHVLSWLQARSLTPNAVVFLSVKQKGRGHGYTPVTQEAFNTLINRAYVLGVPFGFDSCSAKKFETYLRGASWSDEEKQRVAQMVEPWESGLFSAYVNVRGEFSPCSFCEGTAWLGEDTPGGMSVLDCDDFVKHIWQSASIRAWRTRLLTGNRACPVYTV